MGPSVPNTSVGNSFTQADSAPSTGSSGTAGTGIKSSASRASFHQSRNRTSHPAAESRGATPPSHRCGGCRSERPHPSRGAGGAASCAPPAGSAGFMSQNAFTTSQTSSEPGKVSRSLSTRDFTASPSRYMNTPSARKRNGPECAEITDIHASPSTDDAIR